MTQQMYIGPSIPGIVKKGTVFINDLPKQLSDVIEQNTYIKNLMIPIEEITKKMKALSEQGSVENVSYCRIVDYLKGEKS